MLVKVTVHDSNGGIVGKGTIIFGPFGPDDPVLFDLKGNPLESGWFTIQPTNEEKLVVWNRTVQ